MLANRYIVRDVAEVDDDGHARRLHARRGERDRYSTNLWKVGAHLAAVHAEGTPGAKPFERLPPEARRVRTVDGRRVVDWLLVFGGDEKVELAPYTNDRLWRALSLFAPSAGGRPGGWPWPPRTPLATGIYPTSTPPDAPIDAAAVRQLARDVYRGASQPSLDLTRGLAAGPYGDPTRYDVSNPFAAPGAGGSFPRAISMFRTSYSHVTEIGRDGPRDGASGGSATRLGALRVRARVWLAQGAPHAAVYTLVHVLPDVPAAARDAAALHDAALEIPAYLSSGSLHRADAYDAVASVSGF